MAMLDSPFQYPSTLNDGRFDLSDTTFLIPVKVDSQERYQNIQLSCRFILENFDTTLMTYEVPTLIEGKETIVMEDLKSEYLEEFKNRPSQRDTHWWTFTGWGHSKIKSFYRTNYLNQMLAEVKTPIVINYDADILMDPQALLLACHKIRHKEADLVYPFALGYSQGRIHSARVVYDLVTKNYFNGRAWAEEQLTSCVEKGREFWEGDDIPSHTLWTSSAYGHAQVFNTEVYKKGGGENEFFLGWGPEDKERYYRFKGLGYKVMHLDNKIFHLEHPRGPDSSSRNPHYRDSWKEAFKVVNASKEQLVQYVEELKKANQC